MPTAVYDIFVDWNNDGDFLDANEDITSDVKTIGYSRGKDDELSKAKVGQLTLTVNNANGKYSPPNTGSVLTGLLLPRRSIRVRATFASITYNLFYGYIEEIVPHPHWQEQDVVITALDGLDYLARQELDTILYKDTLTGTLVTNILDNAGWSATLRSIDTGQDTVPYAYWSKVKARFALGEIEDSEQGFIYINGAGNLVYEDRWHRYGATHQTSQATFNDTMAGITYSLNPKRIYNIARATVTPWELKVEAELWRLEEVPSIPIGGSGTWWGDSEFFVDAWVTPVITTDYTANSQADGLGTDMTANIGVVTTKFAQTIKLVLTNNGTVPAFITLLKARGTYYDDLTKVTRKSEDATSQTAYQKRTLPFDGKYLTDADKAQAYTDYAIAKYKDPQAEVSITIQNKTDALLTQILSREISDRITTANTELGLNAGYFIDAMSHSIDISGLSHSTTYLLRDATNEDFWCLDYSALGTGTKLAYA